jgi:hypothetical protein
MKPHIRALRAAERALAKWNTTDSASATGHVLEEIKPGHPLHAAIDRLQQFYEGALPRPAIGYWRKLLRLTGDGGDDAAEDEAEELAIQLGDWLDAQIEEFQQSPKGSSGKKTAGRKKASYKVQQEELKIWNEWQRARESGVYKGDFVRTKKVKLDEFQKLLNRVASRKRDSEK